MLGGALFVLRASKTASDYHDEIAVTKTWARVSAFPVDAKDLHVDIAGGMFSREFRVSWTAPTSEIEQWLKQSPGTSHATPVTLKIHQRHYAIAPGAGAQFAEVLVDDLENSVEIHVYWS